MPSIRFRLDDPSLEALTARVRTEFGEHARIRSAAEVRVGGIGGFFARRFVDVEVELPGEELSAAGEVWGGFGSGVSGPGAAGPGSAGFARGSAASGAFGPAAASAPSPARGLDALLEAAERAERGENAVVVAAPTTVSTQSGGFQRLMSELQTYVEEPTPMRELTAALPPVLHDEPGGLILFVGLGDDSLGVARSLARTVRRSQIRVGGSLIADDLVRVDDRRSASAARAAGVADGSVALLAWGLGVGIAGVTASLEQLRGIAVDQVWVVVDASRKSVDTASWVGMVRAALPARAIAVVHGVETSTPDSVYGLGLPVGWSDTVG